MNLNPLFFIEFPGASFVFNFIILSLLFLIFKKSSLIFSVKFFVYYLLASIGGLVLNLAGFPLLAIIISLPFIQKINLGSFGLPVVVLILFLPALVSSFLLNYFLAKKFWKFSLILNLITAFFLALSSNFIFQIFYSDILLKKL